MTSIDRLTRTYDLAVREHTQATARTRALEKDLDKAEATERDAATTVKRARTEADKTKATARLAQATREADKAHARYWSATKDLATSKQKVITAYLALRQSADRTGVVVNIAPPGTHGIQTGHLNGATVTVNGRTRTR